MKGSLFPGVMAPFLDVVSSSDSLGDVNVNPLGCKDVESLTRDKARLRLAMLRLLLSLLPRFL